MSRYPVNREVCEGCTMCTLVTETITGYQLSEEQRYYQCLSDMESECKGAWDTPLEPEINEAWTEEDQAEFDRIFPLGADEYVGY